MTTQAQADDLAHNLAAYRDAGVDMTREDLEARLAADNRLFAIRRMTTGEAVEWLGAFIHVFAFERGIQISVDLGLAITKLEARAEREDTVGMLARCAANQKGNSHFAESLGPEAPNSPWVMAPSDVGRDDYYPLPPVDTGVDA